MRWYFENSIPIILGYYNIGIIFILNNMLYDGFRLLYNIKYNR